MRIAMVSEHASPLAALGGVDAGGQNVHVAALAAALAARGHEVVVYTRRDAADLPRRVPLCDRRTSSSTCRPGRRARSPRTSCCRYMGAFGRDLAAHAGRPSPPDVVHAHFWMSGLAASIGARARSTCRWCRPSTRSARSSGATRAPRDTSPPDRLRLERRSPGSVDRDRRHLHRRGGRAGAGWACRAATVDVVPCGVDLGCSPRRRRAVPRRGTAAAGDRRPAGRAQGRRRRSSGAGRPAGRRAASSPAARPAELDADPEVRRLRRGRGAARGGRPGQLPRAACRARTCPRWSARPTSSSPCRGTSRSASSRWRRWPAAAGGRHRGRRADDTVRRRRDRRPGAAAATRPRSPRRCAALLADERALRRLRPRRAPTGPASRYGWDRVAERDERGLPARARATVGARSRWRWPDDRPRCRPALRHRATALVAALAQLSRPGVAGTADRLGPAAGRACSRRGGRLLAAGNGGSAAQAQHLTAELVGRYRDDRPPFSAIALHAETSSLTAIANDYGADELFARQVEAHGRRGDVLVLLSTSGRCRTCCGGRGRRGGRGLAVWALTGPAPTRWPTRPTRRSPSTPRRRRPCRSCTWSRCTCSAPALDAALGVLPPRPPRTSRPARCVGVTGRAAGRRRRRAARPRPRRHASTGSAPDAPGARSSTDADERARPGGAGAGRGARWRPAGRRGRRWSPRSATTRPAARLRACSRSAASAGRAADRRRRRRRSCGCGPATSRCCGSTAADAGARRRAAAADGRRGDALAPRDAVLVARLRPAASPRDRRRARALLAAAAADAGRLGPAPARRRRRCRAPAGHARTRRRRRALRRRPAAPDVAGAALPRGRARRGAAPALARAARSRHPGRRAARCSPTATGAPLVVPRRARRRRRPLRRRRPVRRRRGRRAGRRRGHRRGGAAGGRRGLGVRRRRRGRRRPRPAPSPTASPRPAPDARRVAAGARRRAAPSSPPAAASTCCTPATSPCCRPPARSATAWSSASTPTTRCAGSRGRRGRWSREADRARVLEALECVDAVVVFDEDTPERRARPAAARRLGQGRRLRAGRPARGRVLAALGRPGGRAALPGRPLDHAP